MRHLRLKHVEVFSQTCYICRKTFSDSQDDLSESISDPSEQEHPKETAAALAVGPVPDTIGSERMLDQDDELFDCEDCGCRYHLSCISAMPDSSCPLCAR